MATPGAGELIVPAAPAPATEDASPPPPQDDRSAKRGRGGPRQQGAGARILSLGVQAAVMAAALAVFLLFAAASALLLLVLVAAARAFRHHRGSRYRVPSLGGPGARPAQGLSPADIRRIPCFAFIPAAGAAADPCAVCLEAARAGERWRALPACGHAFHAACVDRWLARSPACPVCRAAVDASTR
ncbi:hypothetical protein U9M48_025496 [Paspalum notatum var. saurae]|uniref:RING-type domain-containing protein n=1 Tax=Paspalum notatum var. saurae TaxID=547442 RepID=A0AAQ3WX62_PASNO